MKRKIKRELIEWIVLIVVCGVIYLAGWHTAIIGRIQKVVLSTGIIQPNVVNDEKSASYDFLLEDLNGEKIPFDVFKGEVVFINFWATWCPPCIAEMPDINKLYNDKKDKVRFAMISLDQDETKAKDYLAKKDFQFPVYFLRSPLPRSYNTHAIPTTYVLDKDGIIKVENHGMAKYNTENFKQLLNELSKSK
ncbi:TlpA family protein disulfide reductase [Ekhidna sp.]|uniref:TlpA family protein disulfide reductase n=1 Tax=Ekhidna sp. TaxID=2608089 RepID=UPI003B5CDC2C